MSQVKFEAKETIRSTLNAAKEGKEGFVRDIGNAITKGGSPDGYLAVRIWPKAAAASEGHTLTRR